MNISYFMSLSAALESLHIIKLLPDFEAAGRIAKYPSPKLQLEFLGTGVVSKRDLSECDLPLKNGSYASTVKDVQQLCNNVFQVTLDISGLEWQYSPGDAIAVHCKNSDDTVSAVFGKLDLPEAVGINSPCRVTSQSPLPLHFHGIMTPNIILKQLNLLSFPKKAFLKYLADCCSNPLDEAYLNFLSSAAGAEAYTRLVGFQHNIVDVLCTFSSCRPTLTRLMEHLPCLAPRYYSITNSPKNGLEHIDIVFDCIKYSLNGYAFAGLCSSQLKNLTPGNLVEVSPKIRTKMSFSLDESEDPILMICTGTGLAPFISFLQHMHSNLRKKVLIYGHRRSELDSDQIFGAQLAEFVNQGLELIECLSQENSKYSYVYEALADPEVICGLESASIYVCGSLKMLQSIKKLLWKEYQYEGWN